MIRRQVRRNLTYTALVLVCLLIFAATSFAQQTINHERGLSAQSYLSTSFDHVNLYNGNLTLTVPIGPTYTVGANLKYGLTLVNNSTAWKYKTEWQNANGGSSWRTQAEPNPNANAGHGWTLSLGALYPPNTGFYNTSGSVYLYVAPDGSEHQLAANGVYVTNDGSYLKHTPAERKIEFPDGTIHYFSANTYQVTLMIDRFGNRVEVDSSNPAQWIIRDKCNSCLDYTRTHQINFTTSGGGIWRVDNVILSAFNNATARYDFTYEGPVATRRDQKDDWERIPAVPNVNLWMLKNVQLPASAGAYSFDYFWWPADVGTIDPGVVTAATLPTGGHYKWDWTYYSRPFNRPENPAGYCQPYCPDAVEPSNTTLGVLRKKIYNRATDANPIGTYEYDSTGGPGRVPTFDDLRGYVSVIVRSPQGDDTINYFNIDISPGTSFPSNFYSLPFSSFNPINAGGQTLYLSQVFYKGAWTNNNKKRSVYVKYETAESAGDGRPALPRVAAQRIIYHDDNERYADTFNTDWNGAGQYRQTMTAGNFVSGNVKTTRTEYSGLPGINDPWILNLYTEQKVTQQDAQGVETAYTQFCFDSNTGALMQKRTLKDGGGSAIPTNKDIFVVYTRNRNGNVTSEKYYGGDISLNAPTGDICGAAGTAEFEIQHTYSYGVLATSRYSGLTDAQSFLTVNNIIDRNTGLVKQSTDAAGISTTYEYDVLGRLKLITPADDARTDYEYIAASGAANAEVRIYRKDPRDAVLAQSKLLADAFGRVVREEDSVPDNAGALTQRGKAYNAMGWLTSVSEFGSLSEKTIYSSFDPFGRAEQITAPDSEITEMNYTGVSHIQRKRDIGTTVDVAGTVTETKVAVDEEYDRQGRLVTVTEGSGASNARNQTHYLYDVGDRLKQVSFTGSATPTPPPTANYRGTHDGQNCNSIYGWAQDANNPSSRLSVSVYDDGNGALVATGTANMLRQDLLNAGIGDGRYGFSIPMPAALKDGRNHTLRVKVTGTNFSLAGTPGVFNSQSPACPASGSEYVWVEDAPPTGATLAGVNESWTWMAASPAPFSGTSAHASPLYPAVHQHYFYGATQTMAVATGDRLFAYIYVDPVNRPSQIMLQWYEPATGWEHRAYWGANQIGWGVDGTNSRRYMGGLPASGGWVRLEVAASAVGMEGKTATGMAFALYGGKASWDHAGRYRPTLTAGTAAEFAETEEPSSATATEESPAVNPIMEEPPPIEESQEVFPVEEGQESPATQQGLETPGGETAQLSGVVTAVDDQIRTFDYDNRGFLTSETHPEITGAVTYKYNSLGLMTEKVEGNHRLFYAYDKAARLVSVTDGYTNRVLKSFEYYGTGTLKSLSKLKKATRINWVRDPYAAGPNAAETGINVSEEYSYAEFGGRLSSRTTTLREGGTAPYVFVQTFSYDRLGNVTSQSYPQCTNAPCVNSNAAMPRTVTYDYESGYLKKVGVTGNSTAYGTLTYFSNKMLNTVVHANGVTDTYAKDPDSMARIRRVSFARTGGLNWSSGDYEYDGAGNVTEIGTDWFTYDHANRVKEGTAGVDAQSRRYKQSYLYDQMGNMTRRTTTKNGVTEVTNLTVDVATNRLGGIIYDAAGNALGFNRSDVYVYDPLNMTKKTPGKTYLYGPTDERVWMVDKGYNDLGTIHYPLPQIVETITLRGLNNEVLREYQLTGANAAGNWRWLQDNIYRGAALLAAETSGQGRRDYHIDHLGSARYVTNSTGQATEVMWYFPYGMEAQGFSSERKRFTGHERDTNHLPGHVLYYMHARYYGMDQGKFLSVDPERDFDIFQPQSWNLYAYTRGNPINKTDPTGTAGSEAQRQAPMRHTSADGPNPGEMDNQPISYEKFKEFMKEVEARTGTKYTGEALTPVDGPVGAVVSPGKSLITGTGRNVATNLLKEGGEVKVIGAWTHVQKYVGKKGFDTLSLNTWKWSGNKKWLDAGEKFRIVTDMKTAKLAASFGRPGATFLREMKYLRDKYGTTAQRAIEGIVD